MHIGEFQNGKSIKLVNLFFSGRLDKFKVAIRYSKYTLIPHRSIECVFSFFQDCFDVDVFMGITLGRGVDENRG